MLQRYTLLMLCILTANTAVADIQITHLQDYQFGSIDLRYDSSVEHSLCVRNTSGAGYTVAVSSTDDGSQFVMRNLGGKSAIPYHIFWSESANATAYTELKPNMPMQMQNTSALVDCGGSDNANLEIKILASDLHNVSAGQYSTGLEITVAPI